HKAHQLGIKVVIDFIPNHSSQDAVEIIAEKIQSGIIDNQVEAISEALNKNPSELTMDDVLSLYEHFIPDQSINDEELINNFPKHTLHYIRGKRVMVKNGDTALDETNWMDCAQFNIKNKNLIDYLVKILEFWQKEYGIDNFRCDMGHSIELTAPDMIKSITDKIGPIAFSEAHWDRGRDLQDKNVVATQDQHLYWVIRGIISGQNNAYDLTRELKNQKNYYYDSSRLMRFLENHDEQRITSLTGKNMVKTLMVLIALAVPGVPSVYAGQELGIRDKLPITGRQAINWEKGNYSLKEFYSWILNTRKRYQAFQDGYFKILESDNPNIFATFRKNKQEQLIIAANLNQNEDDIQRAEIKLPVNEMSIKETEDDFYKVRDLANNQEFIYTGKELHEGMRVGLNGCDYHVFKIEECEKPRGPPEEYVEMEEREKTETRDDFYNFMNKEWLVTNGMGGYAYSTISGANTRRYHGLLISSPKKGRGRKHLLSKYEDILLVNGKEYNIGTNNYPEERYPQGYIYLKQFDLDPVPTFIFSAGGVDIQKQIFMVHGEDTTVIKYEILNAPEDTSVSIIARPIITARDHHNLHKKNTNINTDSLQEKNTVKLSPYKGIPDIFISHDKDTVYRKNPDWYYNFKYDKEAEQFGEPGMEDGFSPGEFFIPLEKGKSRALVASLNPYYSFDSDKMLKSEIKRKENIYENIEYNNPYIKQLVQAADSFIIKRADGKTSIAAGYPWFDDWGRDAMISLPGLTLTRKEYQEAREILKTFAQYTDKGMLPNVFPGQGEQPMYNTVDASLWFFWSVYKYAQYTGDYKFIKREIYPALMDIINHYKNGTRFNIHMDKDGLIFAGEEGTQLTWMDAKIGDWVVTPRIGKPVEIQALWYNALNIMEDFTRRFGFQEDADEYQNLASKVKNNFNNKFWNEKKECLYDVVDNLEGENEAEIRPNQIFALGLPFKILKREKEKKVLNTIEKELLTPFGLRSLSPGEKGYKGIYRGDILQRDSSYHQGTVWAWLMGPFADAYFKVNGISPRTKEKMGGILRPLLESMKEEGLGTIAEVFDGDMPHLPGGCISQAWSVAEILRIVSEYDLYDEKILNEPLNRIGISINSQIDAEKSFNYALNNGFKTFEFNFDYKVETKQEYLPNNIPDVNRRWFKYKAENNNINLQVNAPVINITDSKQQKEIIDSLEFAKDIGAKVLTLTLTEPGREYAEALKTIIETARANNIVIGIKNGPQISAQDFNKTMGYLIEYDNVGVTFDPMNAAVMENPLDYLDKIQYRIINVDIYDSQKNSDSYLRPGQGELPINKIIKKVIQRGYSGPIIINSEYNNIVHNRIFLNSIILSYLEKKTFTSIAQDMGLEKIIVSENLKQDIIMNNKELEVDNDLFNKIQELSIQAPKLGENLFRILISFERNKGKSTKERAEICKKELYRYMNEYEIVGLPLWFEMYSNDILYKEKYFNEPINKFLIMEYIRKNYIIQKDSIERITESVLRINDDFQKINAEKRIIKSPGSPGRIQGKDEVRYKQSKRTGITDLMNAVDNLMRGIIRIPFIPAVMAESVSEKGSILSVGAYMVGQKIGYSLINFVREYAINSIFKKYEKNKFIPDLNLFENILHST
ncbi:MAG: amylo-alpha-1,6-glucosidase, partial [Elusimicrobiota bacterium]